MYVVSNQAITVCNIDISKHLKYNDYCLSNFTLSDFPSDCQTWYKYFTLLPEKWMRSSLVTTRDTRRNGTFVSWTRPSTLCTPLNIAVTSSWPGMGQCLQILYTGWFFWLSQIIMFYVNEIFLRILHFLG